MPVIAEALPGSRDEDDRVAVEHSEGSRMVLSLQSMHLPAALNQIARLRALRTD